MQQTNFLQQYKPESFHQGIERKFPTGKSVLYLKEASIPFSASPS